MKERLAAALRGEAATQVQEAAASADATASAAPAAVRQVAKAPAQVGNDSTNEAKATGIGRVLAAWAAHKNDADRLADLQVMLAAVPEVNAVGDAAAAAAAVAAATDGASVQAASSQDTALKRVVDSFAPPLAPVHEAEEAFTDSEDDEVDPGAANVP